jgi:hypothetical protein
MAHGAVASQSFGPSVGEILSDWRRAWHVGTVSEQLGRTLAILEHLTKPDPRTDIRTLVENAIGTGVRPAALLSAGYVNFGFNVINRVADGLGAGLPDRADWPRAAAILLRLGYRPLSGELLAFSGRHARNIGSLVDALRKIALVGPARLDADTREALYLGNAHGVLGIFGRKVSDRAPTITNADIEELSRTGVSEDEIFEATICAALGSATRLLTPLLTALDTPSQ